MTLARMLYSAEGEILQDDRPAFVAPGLWLGSCCAEANLDALLGCGISHVVTVRGAVMRLRRGRGCWGLACRGVATLAAPCSQGLCLTRHTARPPAQVGVELIPSHRSRFSYLHIPVLDVPSVDLRRFFRSAFEFIEEGRRAGAAARGSGTGWGVRGVGHAWLCALVAPRLQQLLQGLGGHGLVSHSAVKVRRAAHALHCRRRAGALSGGDQPLRHHRHRLHDVEPAHTLSPGPAARGRGEGSVGWVGWVVGQECASHRLCIPSLSLV